MHKVLVWLSALPQESDHKIFTVIKNAKVGTAANCTRAHQTTATHCTAHADRDAIVLQKITSGSQYGAGAVAFEFAQVRQRTTSDFADFACWRMAPGRMPLVLCLSAAEC